VQTFLSAHFYQNKHDYRGQWLQFTDRLSIARTVAGISGELVSGYCVTFGMVCGAVFIRNDARKGYVLSARHDMFEPLQWISGDDPLVITLSEQREIIALSPDDLSMYPVLSGMLAESRTSFVIPICDSDDLDGFIILGRPLDRNETYTVEDFDLMNTIAHQAAATLLNLRLSEQLVQAREVEVLGKVSAFMIHDLKNHVHTLSLVLDNAREYIADPDFQQDMLVSLENTTARMKLLISKFRELPRKDSLHPEPAELLQLASRVASGIAGPEIRVTGLQVYARVDQEQFPKVLTNLMLNAIEATQGKGPVTVEVGSEADRAYIRVEDKGCGIPEDFFSQHLFQPFKTSKKTGLGIGLYHSRQLTEAHDGRIEAISEEGRGSVFTVWLPMVKGEFKLVNGEIKTGEG
jgi:putative PEP-CTERM system histidine kinase